MYEKPTSVCLTITSSVIVCSRLAKARSGFANRNWPDLIATAIVGQAIRFITSRVADRSGIIGRGNTRRLSIRGQCDAEYRAQSVEKACLEKPAPADNPNL